MKKQFLFLLAGLWLIFLISEKVLAAFLGFRSEKKNLIIRLVTFAGRVIKSAVIFALVVFNVFMAISIIENKKEMKN